MSAPTALERAQDYSFLRNEGLRHIRELAGKVWTDFNLHDPGVTILELLCYAITDLGYRASFDVKDILADISAVSKERDRPSYAAGLILPTAPVTEADYTKMLLDIDGVTGAWLKETQTAPIYFDPVRSTLSTNPIEGAVSFRPRGVYDALIAVAQGADSRAVCERALQRLKQNRNLCQDFEHVTEVPSQDFILCAEIDLDTEADKNLVAAQIYYQVQNHLAPRPRFHSLQQMLERGTTTAEIFDGPVLAHGFLDDAELDKMRLREQIALSDVMAVVLSIPGVRAVRELIVRPCEGSCDLTGCQWTVPVKPSHRPRLIRTDSRIVFYKGAVPGLPDPDALKDALDQFEREADAERGATQRQDLPAPSGVTRDIAAYEPLHNHLPRTYGVDEAGLPDSAPNWRHARARQLKAYLSFYDRILAGYLAQLSRVADLFSADPDIKQTYFAGRLPDDVALVCGSGHDLPRRNRFLDHLLARFAETFNDYVWKRYMAEGNDAAPLETAANRKISLLRNYVQLGHDRFLGVDIDAADNLDSLSGFERRVGYLLGIPNGRNYQVRSRVDPSDDGGATRFWFEIHDDDNGITLRSGDYGSHNEATERLRETIPLAREPGRYRKLHRRTDWQFAFRVVDENTNTVAASPWYGSAEEREQARERFSTFMGRGRFYVVEHILLRPRAAGGTLLRSCPGPEGQLPIDAYSHRMTIVATGATDHFAHIPRRRFAEAVLRNEAPAHIMPRVCWVSDAEMAAFEDAYRKWLKSRSGGQARLVRMLHKLHSVYPSARLGLGETEEVVILDQTMLGSEE